VALFAALGFRCDDVHVHQRTVVNRASGVSMERRWIQVQVPYCEDPIDGRRTVSKFPYFRARARPVHGAALDPGRSFLF
jgi:hypothetical protein